MRDEMKRSCDEVGRYHYIRDGLTGGVITNVSQRFRKVKQPAADEASNTFDNVMAVDSGHLSSGMGLMVLRRG